MWVADRDTEEAEREGVALLTGYSPVQADRVLFVTEGDKVIPVAVLRHDTELIDAVRFVKKADLDGHGPLMRPQDLVDQKRLAQRCKRRESTVSRHWRINVPEFPKPVVTFGQRPIWFWPQVRHWFENRIDRRTLNTKEAHEAKRNS